MEEFVKQYFIATVANSARYFVVAGILFLLFYGFMKNKFEKHKIQAKNATNKDFAREIKESVSTMLIFGLSISVLYATPLVNYTFLYENSDEYGWIYFFITIGISLIIHDTYFYWTHKWMHGKRWYQLVHKTHHVSTNPSPWNSYTFGIVEGIIQAGIIYVLAFILPMSIYALIAFTFIVMVINAYGHLGFEIAPLWLRKTFLFKWMATSTYHNMHHSEFNGNFKLYFRWWDKLMDTEVPHYEEVYDKLQERRSKVN